MIDAETESAKAFVASLYDAMSRTDVEMVRGLLTDEPQLIEDNAGKWLRGTEDVGALLDRMAAGLSGLTNVVRDQHIENLGRYTIVTMTVDQTYVIEGQHVSSSAPTTMLLERVEDGWRLAIYHSVALGGVKLALRQKIAIYRSVAMSRARDGLRERMAQRRSRR